MHHPSSFSWTVFNAAAILVIISILILLFTHNSLNKKLF